MRDIPKASWVPIYFETIDRIVEQAGEKSLRSATPKGDHLEARIWIGFGLGGESGIILRRESGQWTGFQVGSRSRETKVERREIKPRDSWQSTWEALCAKGLLTLPDFDSLPPDPVMVADGVSFVVETFAEGKYRTYMYPNPWAHDHKEARDLEALLAALQREFFGGDARINERKFLSDAELVQLADAVARLKFPMSTREFVSKLPFDLGARGLGSDGAQGEKTHVFHEWPLTSRVGIEGHFVLRAFLNSTDLFRDQAGLETVVRAEVSFYNWIYGERAVLGAGGDPEKIRAELKKRLPVPPSVQK